MRIKSPLRFFIFILTLVIVIWMCYNFIVALQTGQQFSLFGNSRDGRDLQNFVVAGVDADGYRTDVILLCQLQSNPTKVNILQIPRDTKVDNRRNDKKINSAYYSGADVLIDEIYQVTGLKAENSVIVSFDAFKALVDAVGGVTVNVPMRMKYTDPVQDLVIDLEPGEQVLDGEGAEMFMRYRMGYPDGDVGRMRAQQEFYAAVADKLLSPGTIFRLPQIYSAVKENVETDFTNAEIFGMMCKMIGMSKDDLQVFTLPGEGKYIGGGSYFVPHQEEMKKLIDENFSTKLPAPKKKVSTENSDIKVRVIDASGKNRIDAVVQKLEEEGFNVIGKVTWAEVRDKSNLIEYTDKNGSEALLKVFSDIPVTKSESSGEDADVALIIGKDFEL